jgi:hypothetical protein
MTRHSHPEPFGRCLSVAAALLLLLAVTPLRADEIAAAIPKLQAKISHLTCPPGASAQACAAFQKDVSSGTPEVVAQFLPMFKDPKSTLYMIFVVFDSSSDTFWIVSTEVHHDHKKGLVLYRETYGDYQQGQMVTGAVGGEIAASDTTVFRSPKDGVTVEYYLTGKYTFASLETWQGRDGRRRSIAITASKEPDDSDPLSDATITFAAPTQKVVHADKALRFFSRGKTAF